MNNYSKSRGHMHYILIYLYVHTYILYVYILNNYNYLLFIINNNNIGIYKLNCVYELQTTFILSSYAYTRA